MSAPAKANALPIVFAGPSLAAANTDGVDLRPPVRRGDLEALRKERAPGTVLVIDGLFGSNLALTPTECRHLLADGWTVCGASSIGALRAAELYTLGMFGFGDIYNLMRLNVIRSDAEVAVAYHPDTFAEVTASLVHVRAVLQAAERLGIIEKSHRAELLELARSRFWAERSWSTVFSMWKSAGVAGDCLDRLRELSLDAEIHPKKRDAKTALSLVLEMHHDQRTMG
jgi:hypothetical protein